MNQTTWKRTAFCSAPDRLLGRGFCGHLYLADFGLYLMGARLYDPAFGRFLSPDPYVQSLGNTQNLNRYSYSLNNPLKYTDPSGELFVWDSWLLGLFSGGIKEANRRARNDIKIWGGLFAVDENNKNRIKVADARFFSDFSGTFICPMDSLRKAGALLAEYEFYDIEELKGRNWTVCYPDEDR